MFFPRDAEKNAKTIILYYYILIKMFILVKYHQTHRHTHRQLFIDINIHYIANLIENSNN